LINIDAHDLEACSAIPGSSPASATKEIKEPGFFSAGLCVADGAVRQEFSVSRTIFDLSTFNLRESHRDAPSVFSDS
jgi:hypothetical protein